MSNEQTKLLSLTQAAARLGINETSIRRRRCGTERLSHVRPGGGRRILLVEREITALVEEWIKRAQSQTPGAAVEKYLRRAG